MKSQALDPLIQPLACLWIWKDKVMGQNSYFVIVRGDYK